MEDYLERDYYEIILHRTNRERVDTKIELLLEDLMQRTKRERSKMEDYLERDNYEIILHRTNREKIGSKIELL